MSFSCIERLYSVQYLLFDLVCGVTVSLVAAANKTHKTFVQWLKTVSPQVGKFCPQDELPDMDQNIKSKFLKILELENAIKHPVGFSHARADFFSFLFSLSKV